MIGQKLKKGALCTAVALAKGVKRVQVCQEVSRRVGESLRGESNEHVLRRERAEDGRGERLEVLRKAELGRALAQRDRVALVDILEDAGEQPADARSKPPAPALSIAVPQAAQSGTLDVQLLSVPDVEAIAQNVCSGQR